MTLEEFGQLILSADPEATRYEGNRKGNYTVWREYGTRPLGADNRHGESIYRVQVDRFTKIEDDPIAAAITTALNGGEEEDHQDAVAYQYLVDYEVETGYIHHIWDCEMI
ncbi:MAG: hypothetical protein ACOX7B_03305 [Christensenellales bacterium]|jgi:hypothetical protein